MTRSPSQWPGTCLPPPRPSVVDRPHPGDPRARDLLAPAGFPLLAASAQDNPGTGQLAFGLGEDPRVDCLARYGHARFSPGPLVAQPARYLLWRPAFHQVAGDRSRNSGPVSILRPSCGFVIRGRPRLLSMHGTLPGHRAAHPPGYDRFVTPDRDPMSLFSSPFAKPREMSSRSSMKAACAWAPRSLLPFRASREIFTTGRSSPATPDSDVKPVSPVKPDCLDRL